MKILFMHLSPHSKKEGRSAISIASYANGRAMHEYDTGIQRDARNGKGGIEFNGLVGWNGSSEELWNAAQLAERARNRRLVHELQLGLPEGFGAEDRKVTVEKIAQEIHSRFNAAVEYNTHLPSSTTCNHHAHLLFTTRMVENGVLTKKIPEFTNLKNSRNALRMLRNLCADILNERCQHLNLEIVSPHSYALQGSERLPTLHVGSLETPRSREKQRNNALTRGKNLQHAVPPQDSAGAPSQHSSREEIARRLQMDLAKTKRLCASMGLSKELD